MIYRTYRRQFSNQMRARIAILAVIASALAAAQSRTFTEQYCVVCHNNKLKTAGFSLEGLDPAEAGSRAAGGETVVKKLRAGEMPPPGAPHPSKAAADAFRAKLEGELDAAAAAHPNPGAPAMHRLNRAEYANAIRDLLGIEIDASATLPNDDSGYGFDNIADVLSTSPALLERYISIARAASRLAVGDTNIKPTRERYLPRDTGPPGSGPPRPERASDDLPFGSRNGLAIRKDFPVDADYEIRVDLPADSEGVPTPPVELKLPITAGPHVLGVTFFRANAKPERESPPVRGEAVPNKITGSEKLDVRLDGARIQMFDVPVRGRPAQVTGVTIAGPFEIRGPGDSPSRRKIFVCYPARASEEEACARRILSTLARLAYRRPAANADVAPLMGFFERARRTGSFEAGIEKAIEAMLVSPKFLFRLERDPAGTEPGAAHAISDLELASRLSFFLWSSIPDDSLLKLAEQNKLRDPAVLDGQVRRMLEDRRSRALVENFAGQWLYLRNIPLAKPDPDVFSAFDQSLRLSMLEETQLFFEEILRRNQSVMELLEAHFTFLNERLAKHYGIAGVYGSQFRKVALADGKRGGLLGQASILTVTSYPNRTSVVQRGKWILENLLGTPPPPPPPDVPVLDPHGKDGKMTLRQAMEAHRANPGCAACHARMDPIGFALENYDGIGQWRNKDESGAAIDASGKLPDGSAFDGPAGLRKLLANERREEFVQTLTEKLLTYALGRGLESYDQPAVRAILRQTAANQYRLGDLITAVVHSTPFQMRRSPEP
jgi:cytochrome c551/c552